MISSLLTLMIFGMVALVVLGVGLAVVGAILGVTVGLGALLLFKVLPLVLIGYFVVRFLRPRSRQLTDADRRWLES